MQYLAICQQCRFAFALPARMDVADCPKPDCEGTAVVSDGSFASIFQVLHELYPMAMPKEQRREISKLLRKMAAGKVTAEEALADRSLSPETQKILIALAGLGLNALGFIVMLFMYLQAQSHHVEDRRDQAQAHEDQRRFLETLAANLEHLHQDDATLVNRLRRAQEAQLVDIEEEQSATPPRHQAGSAAAPKPRSQGPKPTPKKKKGKKGA